MMNKSKKNLIEQDQSISSRTYADPKPINWPSVLGPLSGPYCYGDMENKTRTDSEGRPLPITQEDKDLTAETLKISLINKTLNLFKNNETYSYSNLAFPKHGIFYIADIKHHPTKWQIIITVKDKATSKLSLDLMYNVEQRFSYPVYGFEVLNSPDPNVRWVYNFTLVKMFNCFLGGGYLVAKPLNTDVGQMPTFYPNAYSKINEQINNKKMKKVNIILTEEQIERLLRKRISEQLDMDEVTYQEYRERDDFADFRNAFKLNRRIGVAFVAKKDNMVRHMAITRYLKAYRASENAKTELQQNVQQNNDLIRVVDINKYRKLLHETGDRELAAAGAWRSILLNNLLAYMVGGHVHDLREENQIMQRFGQEVYDSLTPGMIRAMHVDVQDAEEVNIPENPDEPENPEPVAESSIKSKIKKMIKERYSSEDFLDYDYDDYGYDKYKESLQSRIEINGKPVDVSSIMVDGIDRDDYPDFVDAYASEGYFEDGTPLSDDELDKFTEKYSDVVQDKAREMFSGSF